MKLADVVGQRVEHDDGLPEHLGSLREHFVEDAEAAVNLVRQNGEGPAGSKQQVTELRGATEPIHFGGKT